MIKFKELTYKNFYSVGNHPIKIQLDRSPTTLIGGSNGSGKCLSKDTKVDIMFETQEELDDFLDFINK